MRTFIRKAAPFAAVLATSVMASVVHAEATSNAAGVYDKLGTGKLEIPKTSSNPKSIPATEKVDGIYAEIPPHYRGRGDGGPTYAMIYASADEANARNSGKEVTGPLTCFMNAYPSAAQDVNWSQNFATTTSIQNYKQQNYPGAIQYGSVNLVRADKVVSETKDKLSYEVKIAYVDAETLGVRLHSKQTLEFTLIDEMPGKVKVWGAKSDDQITILVRREKHEKERFFIGPLMATLNGQHMSSGSDGCPTVFSMKTGKNISQSAVVQLDVLLSVEEVGGEEGGFIASLPARKNPVDQPTGPLEGKVRSMRVGISNSWMSQDTKPVVSVSSGWVGRERTQPL